MHSSPGSEIQQLDFSESRELLAFLSQSRAPDALTLHKRVFSELGFISAGKALPTRRFVQEWASVLPFRLAALSTKWAAHLTLLEARQRFSDSVRSGRAGEVVGEVEVLILSTSKRDDISSEGLLELR